MTAWRVTAARAGTGDTDDKARLDQLLADGWEPWAVTAAAAGWVYHLKRQGDET